MTAFFRNKVLPFLFLWEGTSYEDDPDDPGNTPPKGANQYYRGTKYGIDARSHPNIDIKNLTADSAGDIYWSDWLRMGCDHLSQNTGWVFFDTAQNLGIGRANEFLKQSNGNLGKFLDLREEKYRQIGQDHPRLEKFVRGWINRAEDLRKQVV
jgi:lysozyme family protein